MSNKDLFKEAIADAKAVREAALANAKVALEEALAPKLQSMLSAKLQEMDMEEEGLEEEKLEEKSLGQDTYRTDDFQHVGARERHAALEENEEELEEDFDLSSILAELSDDEEKPEMNEAEEEEEAEDEEMEAEEDEAEMVAQIDREIAQLKRREQAEKDSNEMLIQAETDLQEAKRGALDQGLNMLLQFAGKNKVVALGILAIQKGLAIADVVVGASKSILLAKANLAAVPAVIGVVPNPLYAVQAAATLKGIATTKIGAGISIASILAAGITGAKSIAGGSGSGAASVGGVGGAGGGVGSAPQFNVVGNTGVNQIANTLQNQPPVQAIVVASNVTSAQSANRNIVQSASLG